MFVHLLESSHRDDSYKWTNIGFGEELHTYNCLNLILRSISRALVNTHVNQIINPFSVGTAFMHMQTGWIQASRRLAWDPACLLLSLSLPIKNKQNLKVLKSRRQYNLFLENYPAFKGLIYVHFCQLWVPEIVKQIQSNPGNALLFF